MPHTYMNTEFSTGRSFNSLYLVHSDFGLSIELSHWIHNPLPDKYRHFFGKGVFSMYTVGNMA